MIDKPISSANALRVALRGRFLTSLSIRRSKHSTKRMGDIGHPWRAPECRVIDGKSSEPNLS